MNEWKSKTFWLTLMGLALLAVSLIDKPAQKTAEAQLVNVEVDSDQWVIGEEPELLENGLYRLRRSFPKARTVAVYVDGKRISKDEYSVRRRQLTIDRLERRIEQPTVIVDYILR